MHRLKSSHETAEATQERNEQLRRAFGISKDYTDGASFMEKKKMEGGGGEAGKRLVGWFI